MAEKGSLFTRFKNAWNVFSNKDPTPEGDVGWIYSNRPDRVQLTRGNEKSIVGAIYNRIALDTAQLDIRHVLKDEKGRFKEIVDDSLNYCFTTEANIDQTPMAFKMDIILSLFDEGYVAVYPLETSENPNFTQAFDIYSLRTGKIIEWAPNRVLIRGYDEQTGQIREKWMMKANVAIIENPFYAVMNAPNSIGQRLIRKLNVLDALDERINSGRFNIIVQLPYTTRNEQKQEQAEKRRKAIEDQLARSKYGIAYIDGTEHITELNRGVENNLMEQIDYLTSMLYGQLGMTPEILNQTASEEVMANYFSRVCVPTINTIVEEMNRKYLTKTARSQKHAIMWFNDPFKGIPTSKLAEMSDKLTRNEIVSSNEIRQGIGLAPSDDPKADELVNKNISRSAEEEKLDDLSSKLNIQGGK